MDITEDTPGRRMPYVEGNGSRGKTVRAGVRRVGVQSCGPCYVPVIVPVQQDQLMSPSNSGKVRKFPNCHEKETSVALG